jgi:hypothetical protein
MGIGFSLARILSLAFILIGTTPAILSQSLGAQSTQGSTETGGQKVKLYFLREATKIGAVLNVIAKQDKSDLNGLIITNATEDEIILYGPRDKRDSARRVIATLDLPRTGIRMEMWGLQISSSKPDKMAEVMRRIRKEIDRTQQAVRGTYEQLQQITREVIRDCERPAPDCLDVRFRNLLEKELGYGSALSANRPLSLTDVLLRMVAAQDPSKAAKDIVTRLSAWLDDNHPEYVKRVTDLGKQPFDRFFLTRGLSYSNGKLDKVKDSAKEKAYWGREALLEFAVNYGRLVHQPNHFSPYYLQQAAEILNSRLQSALESLNLDMQDLFVTPTLDNIRDIVASSNGTVEYAQVGKTTVASLSGISTEVSSHSVSAFDVTPPLRLSELLEKAKNISNQASAFIPKETQPGAQAATELTAGALPISQIIGLLAAFGEERSVWRELQAGVSLTITPNVLRNMTSAELQVNLKTGDPQAGTREQGVRPLSRVSQHDLKTSVYVDALDFFDLSAFASQSTLDGGRGYVPVIGPIWRGLFGEVPVLGNLFSWKRNSKNVYHQSLVLTTSFITPTAMGVAILYPTDLLERSGECKEEDLDKLFNCQLGKVKDYRILLDAELKAQK